MKKTRLVRLMPYVGAFALATIALPIAVRAESMSNSAKTGISHAAEDTKSAAGDTAETAKTMVSGAPSGTAADILSKMHATNRTEIDVGAMAEKNGNSADVRSFGKELVTDHSAADGKVLALAQEMQVELSPPSNPSVGLVRKEHKDADVKKKLSEEKGTDFDREFLKAMVEDHKKDISELSAAAEDSATDPKLKTLIEGLMPTLKMHQQTAQRLLELSNHASM